MACWPGFSSTEHSAGLREHAGEQAARLWLYAAADDRGGVHGRVFAFPRSQYQRRVFGAATGLLGDDGRPLPLHGGRIRATYQHRRDRSAWTGRSTRLARGDSAGNTSKPVSSANSAMDTARHSGTSVLVAT